MPPSAQATPSLPTVTSVDNKLTVDELPTNAPGSEAPALIATMPAQAELPSASESAPSSFCPALDVVDEEPIVVTDSDGESADALPPATGENVTEVAVLDDARAAANESTAARTKDENVRTVWLNASTTGSGWGFWFVSNIWGKPAEILQHVFWTLSLPVTVSFAITFVATSFLVATELAFNFGVTAGVCYGLLHLQHEVLQYLLDSGDKRSFFQVAVGMSETTSFADVVTLKLANMTFKQTRSAVHTAVLGETLALAVETGGKTGGSISISDGGGREP